jgi:hypothetical protein
MKAEAAYHGGGHHFRSENEEDMALDQYAGPLALRHNQNSRFAYFTCLHKLYINITFIYITPFIFQFFGNQFSQRKIIIFTSFCIKKIPTCK